MEVIKGYKVFNPNWTAQHGNFRYKVGKEYEMGGEIIPCKRGFHFCEKLEDCFDYYIFTPNLKAAEVEGTGQIKREENKICCSHIRIVKEISIDEVLRLVNNGVGNIGIRNQGSDNKGNGNQGNWNQGNWNQGSDNKGNGNRGNWNQGNRNQGNDNRGNNNRGNWNQGSHNQGDGNRGDNNQGKDNIGIGNKGNYIVGLWCTQKQPFYLFNKLCSIPFDEFEQSENYELLIRLTQAENPQLEWESFTPEEKQITLSTENITPEVFKELFDIDVIGE